MGPSAFLVSALAAIWLSGCSPQPASRPEEDSLTSGRIKIVCAPEAEPLIAREQAAFQALYPQAHIELVTGSSREAVRALFAADCDLAVITRELDVEERAAAVRGRLELDGYRFARDAVVAIVNPGNGIENVSVEELRKVYEGKVGRWSELGGRPEPIEPVIQPQESDMTQYFMQQVMNGAPIQARVYTEASDSAVVARVSGNRRALGYISMAWEGRGAKTLRLASVTGLPYLMPDAEAVFKGTYSLTRLYNFYVRSTGPRLANGFITFVTSRDGQALVHDYGLVPTSVPVRFVRRSPMQSTHR
jgi:phosphate transport system substrate-binding protein